ncbi:MAG: Mrp/NBP35 family ATP-binding protein [Thermoplasmata archaeon]|nr:Mrp/NBP35 family ATP-binding protein [Thermoplasmata archaeon]MCI4341760.1 Mrp/NBP35 family ATP-binding protein [Thermoplasmata archaeon]
MSAQAPSTPPTAPSAGPRRAAPGSVLQRMEKGAIRHVVAVGSGKGGVGKSSVTTLLAGELLRRGNSVGILDADVGGSSVPKLVGAKGPLLDKGEGIEPAVTPEGLRLVASQFLVEQEETPVVWRGPLVTRLILQFFGGVNWGPLDYLLVDMAPGTSDVPLTIFQTLPLDGMLFIVSPQELATLIVKKAMNMARDLHVPLLGLVENLAYLTCPHCGERIEPFGPGRGRALADEYGIPMVAQLPIDPGVSSRGDLGSLLGYSSPAITQLGDGFLAALRDAKKRELTVL